MSLSIRFMAEAVRELAFGSMGASYMGIGTTLTKPVRMLYIQNLTDALLMFSFDGVEDHFPLPSNGYVILDITANKTLEQGFFLGEGQRMYVKNITSPSAGSVYVSTFYGAQ